MFSTRTTLPFASADTSGELHTAFSILKEEVARTVTEPEADAAAAAAELILAAGHGIVTLLAANRIPPDRVCDHIVRIAGFAADSASRF
ncbi:hypothetical protein I6E68_00090 [Salinibacterium sp. NSLL150]|uniref:hypothetical protein n=1 Tax=unclassified Salinibacterium TaxID=2632331 RepID=UPI0018CD44E1|nr:MULTISPECIES: hypothetical protein [unclassified Salinibacterium]MBH0097534.1 hypothetical protein [Salinibacterium sp. NSLL35]MBH0100289.1 hypothetical protein [Salinibacterium sp. NSLL150]MBH0103048.1 hypothetical protein [Salinibacterium sp. NSLL16]MBH0105809.1 hypothetical protein [Salinibacterium sp. NSLL17]